MRKKKFLYGSNIVLLVLLFVCFGSQSECYAKMNNSYYFYEVAKYYGIYDSFINTNSSTNIQNFESNINKWNGCIIKYASSNPVTLSINGCDYYVNSSNGSAGTFHSPRYNKEWNIVSNNNFSLSGTEWNSNTNVNYNVNNNGYWTYQFIIAPTNSATGRLKANQTNGILIFNLDIFFGTITQGYIDSSIPDIFQIGTAEIGLNIDNNSISYRLYSYDEDLQQKIELNQALTSEYISEGLSYNYNIYAEKHYITQSGSYALYYVLDNNEYLLDVAYIVVDNGGGGGSSSGDIGNSGTITNVSGDKTGNIDLSGIENRQDATNQKLDEINNSIKDIQSQISGDNEKLINTITDGTPSGELIVPDIEIENPAENFYQNIYNHLINGLKNTDNASITFKIPNGEGSFNDYIINSSDMAWSVPELDNFINLIWWLGFGYSLFKVVYKVYEHITQADFSELENTIKSDKDIL